MICSKCGTDNGEGTAFCANCGTPLGVQQTEQASATQTPPPAYYQNNAQTSQQPYVVQPVQVTVSEEYRPISMWGYFGYEILFSIPCIGFILLLVFSFGGTRNINLKNFARSYFCFLIISLILVGLFMLLGGAAMIASIGSGY